MAMRKKIVAVTRHGTLNLFKLSSGYSRRDAQFLRITGTMTMDEAR
jgi:hypothetical protein